MGPIALTMSEKWNSSLIFIIHFYIVFVHYSRRFYVNLVRKVSGEKKRLIITFNSHLHDVMSIERYVTANHFGHKKEYSHFTLVLLFLLHNYKLQKPKNYNINLN